MTTEIEIIKGRGKNPEEDKWERSPVERPGYVAVCERCKFISYEDRHVYCGQGHWYGDDDPENIPDSLEKDLWADCEDFAT